MIARGLQNISADRKLDKRAKAERISQLRSLQARQARGLPLSKADEVRLAELMAENRHLVSGKAAGESADGKTGKDCAVM
ncbi:unnamed protein product [Jaminaea pallidilutea]